MRIAVLDADVIAYISSAEAEGYNDLRWDEDTPDRGGGFDKAREVAESMIQQWREGAEADEVVLALSGETYLNFRRDVCPVYKSSRSTEKPDHYVELVKWMQRNYECRSEENLEGDDILGLMTTSGEADVAVSTDKDILTLPAHVVHIRKHKFYHYEADLERADLHWMTQTLTGDTVDGYKGAPGIGAVHAEKLLRGRSHLPSMWDAVVNGYGKQLRKKNYAPKFITASAYREALMNARCARILRDGDYDFTTKEVRLWTP